MSRTIRALYLQPAAQFGGAERQAATIVPLLQEHGIETIPVVGPGQQIVEWLRERGVTDLIHSRAFPDAPIVQPPTGTLGTLLRYKDHVLQFRDELARIVLEREPDIIIAAMGFSWVSATPVARALGIPIVWRAGGTECTVWERTALSAWARWNRPDRLICNGDSVARMFGRMIGAPTCVIRNGLDDRQFYPGAASPASVRERDARVVIGFASRLVPQKRPEDFIAAARHWAGRQDISFLLAGDSRHRERYQELARASGAPIDVVGFVRDMRAFYAACDVFVLPSRSEGCPNVVLEAMAMGTAVVAADAPATREIVRHGHDGLLYPIGNIGALVTQLTQVIERPIRRAELAQRGLERVRDFSANDCAARTAAVLRELVTDPLRRPRRALPRGMDLLVSRPA